MVGHFCASDSVFLSVLRRVKIHHNQVALPDVFCSVVYAQQESTGPLFPFSQQTCSSCPMGDGRWRAAAAQPVPLP